jgi:hypothetical protein
MYPIESDKPVGGDEKADDKENDPAQDEEKKRLKPSQGTLIYWGFRKEEIQFSVCS